MMRVIKRSGEEVNFDVNKIVHAISKASKATDHEQMSDQDIQEVARKVEDKCEGLKRAANVEEIQDMVENEIMRHG